MKQIFFGDAAADTASTDETRSNLNFITAFGVLLYHVALADKSFTADERDCIMKILAKHGIENEPDRERLFERIKSQHANQVDLFEFSHELKETLSYEERYLVIHDLFRVAFSDSELHNDEVERIRKIAGLLYVPHDNFIHAKITARKSAPEKD